MSEEPVEVIRRSNRAFNAGDYDAMVALLDREVEFVDHLPLPDVAHTGRGAEEVKAVLSAWRQGFVGFQAEVEEYLGLGEFVVCTTRWRFRSQGEGIELEWRGAEAYEVLEGKVVWAQVGFTDRGAAIEAVQARSGAAS